MPAAPPSRRLPARAVLPTIILMMTALGACATDPAPETNDDHPRLDHSRTPLPVYPPSARAAGLEGSVQVQCDIDASGRPLQCAPVSATAPVFVDAALDEGMKARYLPALHAGSPVPGRITFNVRFALSKRAPSSETRNPRIDTARTPRLQIRTQPGDPKPPPGQLVAQGACKVDIQGMPSDCQVTADWAPLREGMARFLAAAHFHPALRNGVPVDGIAHATTVFTPDDLLKDGFGD